MVIVIIPYVVSRFFFFEPLNLSDQIRWSGMILQFAGLGMIVIGLNVSRQLFGKSSIWKAIGLWLGRTRHIIILPKARDVTVFVDGFKMRAEAFAPRVFATNHKNTEERISYLEKEILNLYKEIDKKEKKYIEEIEKLKSESRKGISEMKNESGDIKKLLESASIGGIHIEISGVMYIFLGIAFTSIPNEISYSLNFLFG